MIKRVFLTGLFFCMVCSAFAQQKHLLACDKLKTYVESFNKIDTVKNYVANDDVYEWVAKNT